MRFYSLVLLAAAALLACADSVSVATTPNKIAHNIQAVTRSFADNDSGIAPKRLLRTFETTDENDEERAGGGMISGLVKAGMSKVDNIIGSAKLSKYLFSNNNGVEVLTKLKLGKDAEAALKNPKLNALITYITMFNKKHPDKTISLLGTLTTRYGDDGVAKALVTAKRADDTKDIATKLQKQQFDGWLNSETSADGLFALLKIKDDGIMSMKTRKLETLEDYIHLLNVKNPQEKTSTFRVLRNGFGGDDQFALMVTNALQRADSPKMHATALKYQDLLFRRWEVSKLDPMSVFIKVFNVPEDKLATASFMQKWVVVDQYRPFYNKAMAREHVPSIVTPRR